MADLERKPLDGARDHRERGEVERVPVARDDLRRDRLRREPEPRRDMRLDLGPDIGEGADRAGDGAGRDLVPRLLEPPLRALELGMEARELQPEGRGLGMDAVAAADRE